MKNGDTAGKNRGRILFLLLSSMMTMMGGAAVAPSLPGISATFSTYPESVIAMIITLPPLAIVLTGWCIGIICDRVGKVKPLMISLAFFALFGSSGVYLSSLEMILVGRAMLGVAIAGIMTTTNALIAAYYTGPERAKVIGYQTAGMGIGAIVLETSGGYLASIDWRAAFYIYLIALLFIPGILWTMKEPEQIERSSQKTGTEFENASVSSIHWGHIALIYLATFSVMLIFYMIPTKLPYLLQASGITSTIISGVLLGIAGFSQGFSALSCSRFNARFSRQIILALGFSLMAIGALIIGTMPDLAFLIGGLILTGIGMGFIITMLIGWLGDLSPVHRYGTAFGLFSMFLYLGQFMSGFVAQPLIDFGGSYGALFVYSGLYSIVLAAVFAFFAIGPKVLAKSGKNPVDS
ncbi:MFS transporter [Methanogenium marinum]|nr:MFS transporter [Methanogenium marinum]